MPHISTAIQLAKFQDFIVNFLGKIKRALPKSKKQQGSTKLTATCEQRLMITMKACQV